MVGGCCPFPCWAPGPTSVHPQVPVPGGCSEKPAQAPGLIGEAPRGQACNTAEEHQGGSQLVSGGQCDGGGPGVSTCLTGPDLTLHPPGALGNVGEALDFPPEAGDGVKAFCLCVTGRLISKVWKIWDEESRACSWIARVKFPALPWTSRWPSKSGGYLPPQPGEC